MNCHASLVRGQIDEAITGFSRNYKIFFIRLALAEAIWMMLIFMFG
jgi:hypothetical protein